MSNKNLLNESQIRQFMKLAKLEPLAPGFVEGLAETHGRGMNDAPQYDGRRRVQEDDELEVELGAPENELGAEDQLADEEAEEVDDLSAGDLGAPADENRMISVDDFLGALETALEGVMGDEVEIDSSEMTDEAPEDEELEVDAELAPPGDVDPMAAEEDEGLMEGEDEDVTTEGAEDELEEDKDNVKEESTEAADELVEQITKRVAARILKSALAEK
ncbi:hypothetical protein CMI37_23595 [Candidatus Pacearchaeota archaeon]|nr:hypothetical protein [Candidatus Pacearchaeota archaeon]|tara:strand:+ start:15521 stop:16174 length:654 start_codon:yes stop_codon:yes gene_type:complete